MAFNSLAKDQVLFDAIVVGNSVMMRWLFKDGSKNDQQYAQAFLHHIEAKKPQVIVPYVWVYEASFVVNYYSKKGLVSYENGINHLDSLFNLCAVIRGEETPSALFDFSNANGLSAYDASYVMLALQQSSPIAPLRLALRQNLSTLNGGFSNVKGIPCTVTVNVGSQIS